MRRTLRIVRTLMAAIPFLGYEAYAQQDIHIEGTVTGIPNYNPVYLNQVVATNVSTGDTLDLTTTDINGQFTMDFLWTGARNQETPENRLYPNPYHAETNIEFNAVPGDHCLLTVSDANGNLISSRSAFLHSGWNKIHLTGGSAGLHIITLKSGKEMQSFKAVQLSNTGAPINYSTSTIAGSALKSAADEPLMVGDEIKLTFTHPNTDPKNSYDQKDTVFIVQPNQVINQALEQMPYTVSFTFKPFLETGEQITTIAPDWTTTLQWPDGETTTHPVVNQQIQVTKNLYPNNGDLGNVSISNDTTTHVVNSVPNGVQP